MRQSRKSNWIVRFFLLFLAVALILAVWPVSNIQTAGDAADAAVALAGMANTRRSGAPSNGPAGTAMKGQAGIQSRGTGVETLKATDKDGFPVPDNYTDYTGEKSAYMQSATATTPVPLKAVLAFYSRELRSRNWSESPGGAVNTEAKAILLFENKKKDQLALKLTRNVKGGTDIRIIVKSKTEAAKDGILPSPGKVRIYLGNMAEKQAVFIIHQKKVVLKMQSTSDQSMKDAPFVEVQPGMHPYTLTLAGEKLIGDKLEVGPNETWALIAGPGGALPIQLY